MKLICPDICPVLNNIALCKYWYYSYWCYSI